MPKYKIYEDYESMVIYEVEAESEEDAIELVTYDPNEYRISDMEDEKPILIRRIAEVQYD